MINMYLAHNKEVISEGTVVNAGNCSEVAEYRTLEKKYSLTWCSDARKMDGTYHSPF